MSELATVGIDLAKSVFQTHDIDENGRVLARRQLRRSQLLAFFQKRPRCGSSLSRGRPARRSWFFTARGTFWFANARRSAMRSERT